jgi:hypothetical protein
MHGPLAPSTTVNTVARDWTVTRERAGQTSFMPFVNQNSCSPGSFSTFFFVVFRLTLPPTCTSRRPVRARASLIEMNPKIDAGLHESEHRQQQAFIMIPAWQSFVHG